MLTSRLSSKGQVTVPKKVREAIGVRPGDLIEYRLEDSSVYLTKVEPLDLAFHQSLNETRDEWDSTADEEAFGDL